MSNAESQPKEGKAEEIIEKFRLSWTSLKFWNPFSRNRIVLTTRRLIMKKDWLVGGTETSVSLDRITDVTVKTGLWGTLFRFGEIRIQTAGSDSVEMQFTKLHKANRLKELIFDLQSDGKVDKQA